MKTYSLYYTLNKNLKNVDLNAKQKKALIIALGKMDDEDKKNAVVLLIAEHFMVVD